MNSRQFGGRDWASRPFHWCVLHHKSIPLHSAIFRAMRIKCFSPFVQLSPHFALQNFAQKLGVMGLCGVIVFFAITPTHVVDAQRKLHG
jgi:hypothetical protein